MFDAQGREVWGADIDAYGDLRNLRGERQACPFRWPGQYEDEESGLYYNRFRYYDTDSASYASQDPIRIRGGLAFYEFSPDPLVTFDLFGLAKCETETFVRWASPEEAAAMVKAKGLVPDVNLAGKPTRKPKWISRKGSERRGTAKASTVRVEITTQKGTTDFLESKKVNFDDVAGEGAAPKNVLVKDNEPGSYGVGKDLLDDFNSRVRGIKIT
jgi:RHS repeat-associated protein